MDLTDSAAAPRLRAWPAKSMAGGGASSPSRLLNGAPPHACWSRWMQPKPWLSRTTITSFAPIATDVAISELSIR